MPRGETEVKQRIYALEVKIGESDEYVFLSKLRNVLPEAYM